MSEKKKRARLTCFGTGLIALDLVTNGDVDSAPRAWAGGSCGNVLTILAYLGWKSYPVARLGDDAAAKTVVKDMTEHGVDFQYVSFDRSVHTPIILQRILIASDGHPTHRFYWICPNCGNWLPRYIPIKLQNIQALCESPPRADCFYFDRVCPASLRLAEKVKEEGALVVLEPPGIKNDLQFRKAIGLCDVLKYSNERAKNSPQLAYESPAKLVVETLGSEGLRYRLRKNGRCGEWKLMPAFRVLNLKDAAGAGDWCTAGMIDVLTGSRIPFDRISEGRIADALRYGQALSALNCGFEGARGAMYSLEKSWFNKKVQSILDREEACIPVVDSLAAGTRKEAQCVCPSCQGTKKRRVRRMK
jgi:sugar/nucleoside kinase (ribokinase family)